MNTHSTTISFTPPGTGGAPRDWRSRAACLRTDPELFFPVAKSGPVHDTQVTAAKAVCAGCPVVAECLAEALVRIPDGIAGGLTAVERGALHRRHQRTASAATRSPSVEGAAQRAGTAMAGGQAA